MMISNGRYEMLSSAPGDRSINARTVMRPSRMVYLKEKIEMECGVRARKWKRETAHGEGYDSWGTLP